jgi:hypothetical protein
MKARFEPPPGLGLRQPSGAFLDGTTVLNAAEGRRSPGRCRADKNALWFIARVKSILVLMAVFAASLLSAAAQQTATNDSIVLFRAVDIYVDSKDKPLAAYQIEFSATNGNARIVGIEGGEHPAFSEPPFYDPKAMQHERVIIAAFSTNIVSILPKGKTRIATIHIQTSSAVEPEFELKLQVAANSKGNKIAAEASAEERKPK